MAESPDNYKPAEVDLDLVLEEATVQPVKLVSLAAGIASLQQRISQLEAEKAKVLDRLNTAAGEIKMALNTGLAAINKDLTTARERLAHYEAQLGTQN